MTLIYDINSEPSVEELKHDYNVHTLRTLILIEKNRIARKHPGEPNQSSEWLDKLEMALKEK